MQCCGSGSGIRDHVRFWTRDPGWKKSRARIRDPGWTFRILFWVSVFSVWVKNYLMRIRIRYLVKPGSGIRDGKNRSGIRDKHPGFATLEKEINFTLYVFPFTFHLQPFIFHLDFPPFFLLVRPSFTLHQIPAFFLYASTFAFHLSFLSTGDQHYIP